MRRVNAGFDFPSVPTERAKAATNFGGVSMRDRGSGLVHQIMNIVRRLESGFGQCFRAVSMMLILLSLTIMLGEHSAMAQGLLDGHHPSDGVQAKSWFAKWPFHGKRETVTQVEIPCPETSEPVPDGFRYSSYCNQLVPRRIVILPAANRLDRLKEQDLFAQSIANALIGHFEVVVSDCPACHSHSPLRTGRFDEQALLDIAKEFNADAVLYLDVEDLSWHVPMRMQVSLLLIHVGEAVALVSGTESIDLNHSRVNLGYHGFQIPESENSILDMRQHSPRTFIRYCSKVVSSKLRQRLSR